MTSIDQQLTDAAIRYFALLQAGTPTSITAFVQDYAPALRDELAAYLQFILATGQPVGATALTADEQAAIDRSRQRGLARIAARLQPTTRSLTAIRNERRLSTGRLAHVVNLPVEVLLRIERGAVILATIPDKLIDRLAAALGASAAGVRAMLATPIAATGTRLSAQDGTIRAEETPISFVEAIARSQATPEQRAEWASDSNDETRS
jgi:hypothetical protein